MYGEPDLKHLRAFVMVAHELHFTRAAERLHLAQQALSKQIQHLEELLGVQLLERTTRRVELTDAGQTLLVHAERLLAAADRAWLDVTQNGAEESSSVRLAYSPTAKDEVLRELLSVVRARYPALTIQTVEAWRNSAGLADPAVDITISRVVPAATPDFEVAALRETRLGVILARDHPIACEGSVVVEQLAGTTLMHSPRAFSPSFYGLILSSLRARNWWGPIAEFENMSNEFLLANPGALAQIASREAFGVGFEGQYPEDLLPGVVWLPIRPDLHLPLRICWHRNARPTVLDVVSVALELARNGDGRPSEPSAKLRAVATI